jgi:hypothetical protein
MSADAVFPPKRRFRDALRHLHHIFHFQCVPLGKGLGH